MALGTNQPPTQRVQDFCPEGKRSQGANSTTHLHPVPRLRTSGVILLSFLFWHLRAQYKCRVLKLHNTRHSVGLLWTSDQPKTEVSDNTQQTDKCPPWPDSNPQSQRPQSHALDRAATDIGDLYRVFFFFALIDRRAPAPSLRPTLCQRCNLRRVSGRLNVRWRQLNKGS